MGVEQASAAKPEHVVRAQIGSGKFVEISSRLWVLEFNLCQESCVESCA